MSIYRERFALGVALIWTQAAAAVGDTFVYEIVGGWTVYTDRARNYACSAEAQYHGDSLVRIGLGVASGDVYLVVADPGWEPIEEGEEYRLAISLDGKKTWAGIGTGTPLIAETERNGLYFSVGESDTDPFIQSFMRAPSIEINRDDGDPVVLSLSGSYRAVESLQECQSAMADMRR